MSGLADSIRRHRGPWAIAGALCFVLSGVRLWDEFGSDALWIGVAMSSGWGLVMMWASHNGRADSGGPT